MADVRPTWEEALDLAVRLGMIPADRAAQLAGTVTGATVMDAASLAASAGVPESAMDALFRLATSLSAKGPADDVPPASGLTDLAADLQIESHAPGPADGVAAPKPVELTLRTRDAAPHRWHFTSPATVLIGRSQRAHVHLEDTHASGVHAVIEVTGLGCRIRDHGSANKTYVNQKVVEVCELAHDDEIRVGRTTLDVSIRATPPSTTRLPAPSMDPEIPGYAIETLLGSGAQGFVYLAKDLGRGGRLVALKTFRLPYGFHEGECEKRAKYFLREAMLAPAFRHPHVVEVHAAGLAGRTIYVVMEYVAGGDLGAYLKRNGPLPCAVACRFALQALEAMAAAHERNLVHRDLKPENLLLTRPAPDGDVKVADLGLAKNFVLAGLSGFTESGTCAGTIEYMAPEQVLDFKYVGPAADVFSLGATLFRLLTGRGMYGADGVRDILQILDTPIPAIASVRSDVPPGIAAVVDRALQREPARRYEHAGQMREALIAALT